MNLESVDPALILILLVSKFLFFSILDDAVFVVTFVEYTSICKVIKNKRLFDFVNFINLHILRFFMFCMSVFTLLSVNLLSINNT